MWSALQKLYGRRFKNADFWETLAKAREAVRFPDPFRPPAHSFPFWAALCPPFCTHKCAAYAHSRGHFVHHIATPLQAVDGPCLAEQQCPAYSTWAQLMAVLNYGAAGGPDGGGAGGQARRAGAAQGGRCGGAAAAVRLFPKAKYWCCLLAAGLTCLLTVRDLNLHVVWAVLRLLSFGHTLCTAILQCTWCASMVLIL